MTRLLLPNRRRLLAFGAALPFARRAQAAPCTLAAEQEVGPFYIADEAMRGDIVEDRAGLPLALRLQVLDSRTCKPLAAAAVDLWHCDATGLYSGFTRMPAMVPPPEGPPPGRPGNAILRRGLPPGPPPQMRPTDKLTFLRGIQLTDGSGVATFQTIVPGCYVARTNHIHFKVRLSGSVSGPSYRAGHTSHVGQVFFPEDAVLQVMEQAPYSQSKTRRTAQTEDGIFTSQYGTSSMADLRSEGKRTVSAHLVVAVDPDATPQPVRMGR